MNKARSANVDKMGLGLAICKALVTAQNDGIHVESEDKGHRSQMIMSFTPLTPN